MLKILTFSTDDGLFITTKAVGIKEAIQSLGINPKNVLSIHEEVIFDKGSKVFFMFDNKIKKGTVQKTYKRGFVRITGVESKVKAYATVPELMKDLINNIEEEST